MATLLSLIAAVGENRAIGKAQRLLWQLPEDLRHFRAISLGKPVIMGRKTWESLPAAFRPLPGRRNVVVTRNPAYRAPGATLAGSLADALNEAAGAEEVLVVGGAELYRAALPAANRLYLTEVADCPEADAFFPELPPGEWCEVSREDRRDPSGLAFSFVVYQRTQSTK